MTSTALVTGSPDRAAGVSQLFRDAGLETVTMSDHNEVSEAQLPSRVDCYVQLPVTVRPEGETAVARIRSFLLAGLIARFDAIERLLPVLAPESTVVLVSGNLPAESSLPDDQQSRLALLHVLGHATQAELADRGVRVEVVSSRRSDRQIVDYALSGGHDPDAMLRERRTAPRWDKRYEDWRVEVMGMVGVEI